MRGSAPARIDDKGRLKVPTLFRGLIQDVHGPDVFVTSLTGLSVLVYPMATWLDVERKVAAMPRNHPSRVKFLDLVNYYGQTGELDSQGRIVISQLLRESASLVGEVRIFGRIDFLEVWNEAHMKQKLIRDPWTNEDALGMSGYGN
jgi:MraZ protein